MTTRKPCVNVSTATYSGKEQSPLHFGQSAEGYELNTIMQGYDKMMWIVKIKNNKKVWVRHSVTNKMVHEEPVIDNNETPSEINEIVEKPHIPPMPSKPEIIKPVVEEKKITDYNLFLTYRLHELKEQNKGKTNNKELFNSVVAEWKELKKNPDSMRKMMVLAHEFNETHKKPVSK